MLFEVLIKKTQGDQAGLLISRTHTNRAVKTKYLKPRFWVIPYPAKVVFSEDGRDGGFSK